MINSNTLRYDISAGFVVFLVALPLCLGIALASGAPFFSGMIAGIIGGIVVGFLSNSHVSVSGPAAGLTTIVLAGIATLGSFEAFLVALVIAGGIQATMGILKIGSIAEYFPSAVISGMLTAIGIIIILKQIPHGLGYDNDIAFLSEDGVAGFKETLYSLLHFNPAAVLVCLLSLGILILWDRPAIKSRFGILPGGLVVVLLGVGMCEWLFPAVEGWNISAEHKVQVPVPQSIGDFFGLFSLPDFSHLSNPGIYVVAFTIAIVASIETLLCIEAADRLDTQRRVTSTNRELLAQGTGNMLSGLIGGLPITSVIVRTSANVQAQAKTKLSTIIHGTLLCVTVIAIPDILNRIPLSCLAAILLVVGFKLSHPKIFASIYAKGHRQFVPFLITVAAIVATDLLKGVGIGLLVSLFFVLRENLKHSYFLYKDNFQEGDKVSVMLAQEVSFLNKAAIRRTLDRLPKHSTVTIDASRTSYIDSDVIEIIHEFRDIKAPQRDIECILLGFKENYGAQMSGWSKDSEEEKETNGNHKVA
jgi:MFS superfamily sulfate permease-like transporter